MLSGSDEEKIRTLLEENIKLKNSFEDIRSQYKRLVDYGNLLIVRTDTTMAVTDVLGDTWRIVGVSPYEIVRDPTIWTRVVPHEDLQRLKKRVRRIIVKPGDLSMELRVRNQKTGDFSWLLIRGVPLYAPDGTYIGWEGLALDVTDRKISREQLALQNRRMKALFDVSRALQTTTDPAMAMLLGLRAMIEATGSDCGLGFFYGVPAGKLELVAAHGVSERYVRGVQGIVDGKNLVRSVLEAKEGVLLSNVQDDSRASRDLAVMEDLRSTIVVPLMLDDVAYGAITLFCKEEGRYTVEDFEITRAAAQQVLLSARQAEYVTEQREQAASLAVLYRLSHELSKYFTPAEISEHAFPIIQSEIPCKRLWIGVINEQGTHLVGQAGHGPGLRRKIVELQVELDHRKDELTQAIFTRQPVFVDNPSTALCSGLDRLIDRLKPEGFIIVPLVSISQVVGVLIVEPSTPSMVLSHRKMPLLMSMASEVASVILARRFESRLADANKMRMAGLLASGVAHNFNNLLQAVMGQASLIEMQLPPGSPVSSSAHMIVEAANKGAGLVRQLLTFSRQDPSAKRPMSLSEMLKDSKDFYRSIVGSEIALGVHLPEDPLTVVGDNSQIQQIISNLLINAREALNGLREGSVEIRVRRVRLSSGEIDPELPPGAYARIDIQDNGPGMDAERRLRCFEPFFTTKDVDSVTGLGFGGAGLGLSSAYSITKQHEGILTVQSEVGKGALFSIFLPLAAEVSGRGEEGTRDIKPADLHVIIFDVEEAYTKSIESAIEQLGCRVVVTYQREAVRKMLQSMRKAPSLLIVDVDRSGYDTLGFLREIRTAFDRLSCVISSQDVARWQKLLAPLNRIEIIQKPAGVWAVHAAVQRVIQNLATGSESTVAEVSQEVNGSSLPLKMRRLMP